MTPSFEGTLHVTAGPCQKMTLCLTKRGVATDEKVELFVWIDSLVLDERI